MWKIQKIVSKGDYLYAVVPGHPNATDNGYVLEHRIIMENGIGRLLLDSEIVHHIDGNKKNNVIENLEITSASEHSTLHGKYNIKKMVELKCPWCKNLFITEKRKSFLAKKTEYTCCSRGCRGSFARNIQLFGRTNENLISIQENLVREFNKDKLKENEKIVKAEIDKDQELKIIDLKRYNRENLDVRYKKDALRICEYCKKSFNSNGRIRHCSNKCYCLSIRRCERPTYVELQELLCNYPMVKIGKMFGVSDNAVRKWIKSYQKELEKNLDSNQI
jgi:hypothetical protein